MRPDDTCPGSSPPAAARRRTLPIGERREQLMLAARQAFLDLGYDETRISDIVRRAGVAQGTFYLHFQSKAEVYLAITGAMTSAVFDRITAAVAAATNLREAIEAGIDAGFDAMIEQRELLEFVARSPLLPEVRQQTARMGEAAIAQARRFIEAAVASGEIPDIGDPLINARLLHGAVDTIARQLLSAPADMQTKMRRETHAFARRAFGIDSGTLSRR